MKEDGEVVDAPGTRVLGLVRGRKPIVIVSKLVSHCNDVVLMLASLWSRKAQRLRIIPSTILCLCSLLPSSSSSTLSESVSTDAVPLSGSTLGP